MNEEDSTINLTTSLEENLEYCRKQKNYNPKTSIIKTVWRTYKGSFFLVLIMGLLSELISIGNIFLTSVFIKWLRDSSQDTWIGFVVAISIAIILLISFVIRHQFFFIAMNTGTRIRKGLTGLIFQKCMKFNQKSLAKASTGKIVTIVSGELQAIEMGLTLMPYVVISPITTTVAFVLIGINFREAAVIGFLTFILIVICQWIISRFTVKWKYLEGVYSDKRTKVITDSINGIRTIKAYAWEIPFMKLIQKWRRSQLGMLVRNHFVNAIGSGVFINGGFIIALTIFGYHFGMGRTFDYARTLSTITLLSYLSLTSIFFSYTAINNMANFTAILYRVAEIMNMDEFDEEASKDDTTLDDGVRVKLENASMSWGFSILKGKNPKQAKVDEEHYDVNLSSINLEARSGELVAVVGAVGSGKSTLLMAIMHELKTLDGSVKTNGRKAYVEQEPFVMSGTVKDNILVGSDFDKDKFDKVVEAC